MVKMAQSPEIIERYIKVKSEQEVVYDVDPGRTVKKDIQVEKLLELFDRYKHIPEVRQAMDIILYNQNNGDFIKDTTKSLRGCVERNR